MAIVRDDQLDEHLSNPAMAEAFAAAGMQLPEQPAEDIVVVEETNHVPSNTTTPITVETTGEPELVVTTTTRAKSEPVVSNRTVVTPEPKTTTPIKNTRNKETKMAAPKAYESYSLFAQTPVQRTLSLSSGAVDASELRKKFAEIISSDPTVNIGLYGEPEFIVLDAAAVGITFNALIALQSGAEGDKPTYFTMLMEPNDGLPTRPVKYDNHSVNIQTVMAEAYTNEMAARIAKYIANVKAETIENVVEAGWCVIPRGFDIRSDNALENVRPVLYYALNATNCAIDEESEYPRRLELTGADGMRKQLTLVANYNGEIVKTATGLPVRSDVTLTTQLQVRDNNNDVVVVSGNMKINQLSGFVDLFYAPTGSVPNRQTTTSQYTTNTTVDQYWSPRFVITRNQPLTNQIGIGEILLGLANASFLGQDFNWCNAFFPGRAGVGLRDIGALGYEHKFGDRLGMVDTTDPKFNLFEFLDQCVDPKLYFAWDIPDAGDMSWVENVFTQAANGDEEANNRILDAGDVLTGNRFRPALARYGLNSLFTGEVTRIQLGTVPGEDGKDADMRVVDHLALLNLTGKNGPHVAQKWSDNAVMFARDEVHAMYNRQEVIEEIYPNARFTDYASRLSMEGNAIMALAEAIREAGVTFVTNNVAEPAGNRRYSQEYIASSVGPNARSGLFVGGYGGRDNGRSLDRVRTTSIFTRR